MAYRAGKILLISGNRSVHNDSVNNNRETANFVRAKISAAQLQEILQCIQNGDYQGHSRSPAQKRRQTPLGDLVYISSHQVLNTCQLDYKHTNYCCTKLIRKQLSRWLTMSSMRSLTAVIPKTIASGIAVVTGSNDEIWGMNWAQTQHTSISHSSSHSYKKINISDTEA